MRSSSSQSIRCLWLAVMAALAVPASSIRSGFSRHQQAKSLGTAAFHPRSNNFDTLLEEDGRALISQLDTQGSLSTSLSTSTPLSPSCLTAYIYCGEDTSSCLSDTGWTIDLADFDLDNGTSIFCTVRIGSGQCEVDEEDAVIVGSFQISKHNMAVSSLAGYATKEFRIVSSSPDKHDRRILVNDSNQIDIPLGAAEFFDESISIILTICSCDTFQDGCESDDPFFFLPTLFPTPFLPSESDTPSDSPSSSPSGSPSAPPSAVATVLGLEGPATQTALSEADKGESSKPKVALIVASTVVPVVVLLVAACLCSRRRRKTAAEGDADSDSSSSSKHDTGNLSPWSDLEL